MAAGDAEPAAALARLEAVRQTHRVRPRPCGVDKGYDSGPFRLALEGRRIVPPVAMKAGPVGGRFIRRRKDPAAIAARRRMRGRMRTAGYRLSQKTRKQLEEAFGWIKPIGGLARTHLVGRWKVRQLFQMAAAAYNRVRLSRLLSG